jgi:hypothetical protein
MYIFKRRNDLFVLFTVFYILGHVLNVEKKFLNFHLLNISVSIALLIIIWFVGMEQHTFRATVLRYLSLIFTLFGFIGFAGDLNSAVESASIWLLVVSSTPFFINVGILGLLETRWSKK